MEAGIFLRSNAALRAALLEPLVSPYTSLSHRSNRAFRIARIEDLVSGGSGVPARSSEGSFSLRAREAASSERRECLKKFNTQDGTLCKTAYRSCIRVAGLTA